jgi:mRNA interferase RelE/StbE
LKTYSIEFHTLALKEWKKLDCVIQQQFRRQLEKRLANPHVSSARLHGDLANFYKIKLKALGYRLVYDGEVVSAAACNHTHRHSDHTHRPSR